MNYNPYLQNLVMPQTQVQKVVEVSGKNGAEAYMLAPDSSALLLDNTAPIVWLVKTDGAGYKTCVPYDISPHEAEEVTQYKSLEERIAKLEESINAKPNVKSTTRKSESE